MIHILAVKKMTKEVWDAIKAFLVGFEHANKAMVQRLCLEHEFLAPRDSEHIDDLVLYLTRSMSTLNLHEGNISE